MNLYAAQKMNTTIQSLCEFGNERSGGIRAIRVSIVLLLIFVPNSVYGYDEGNLDLANVVVNVSNSSARVVEPFNVEIKVTAPTGAKVTFPGITSRLGDFEIIDFQDVHDIPDESLAQQRIWTRTLTLESLTTGDLSIPQLEMQISNQSESRTIKTQAVPILVTSVLEDRADPTKFRDIRSVVDVNIPMPKTESGVAWWISGGIGSMALALIALVLVSRRKKWVTPKQWALREIDLIEQSSAMDLMQTESVLMKISSVLRTYLQMQFEITTATRTTEEFVNAVFEEGILEESVRDQFADLFELADQAKFAGLQLRKREIQNSLDAAKNLVEISVQLAEQRQDQEVH